MMNLIYLYIFINILCIIFLELPTAECFAFSLNTLLCDVITLAEDIGTEKTIISAQLELLELLAQQLTENKTKGIFTSSSSADSVEQNSVRESFLVHCPFSLEEARTSFSFQTKRNSYYDAHTSDWQPYCK